VRRKSNRQRGERESRVIIRLPEPGAELFGLRRAGRRALTLAERRAVRGQSRRRWGLLAGAVIGCWIALLLAMGVGAAVEDAEGAARLMLAGVTLLLLVGAIAVFLAARHFLAESRALARDARRGSVQQFQGTLPTEAGDDPRLRSLFEAGLVKRDPEAVQSFEILPHSGILWQANGARPRRWISFLPPEPVEVAETPAFAAMAAEWAEPLGGDETPARVGQRDLSPDEVRELRQQTRRALRVRLVWIIPYNLWFWIVIGLALRQGHLPRASGWSFWHDFVSFLLLGGIAIAGDVALARSFREAGRHARDARIGRVVILRSPLMPADGPEAAPPACVTLELLPVSEAVWTVDGEPAGWRTAG
jgi:hypothetical protein